MFPPTGKYNRKSEGSRCNSVCMVGTKIEMLYVIRGMGILSPPPIPKKNLTKRTSSLYFQHLIYSKFVFCVYWYRQSKLTSKLNWYELSLSYYSCCASWIYKLLSAPTKAQFCILCILQLVCSYIFQRSCHPQGAHTNVVKSYMNKIVLQWSYISNMQVLVKIYSI